MDSAIDRYDPSSVVGRNVRRIRELRGYSQDELRERLTAAGWSAARSVVSDVERAGEPGRSRRCNVDEVMFLAVALNVTPLALLIPEANVVVENITMSPAMFTMWWRSVGPVPPTPGTPLEARRARYDEWRDALPPAEVAVFDEVPELLVASQRLGMAVASLSADEEGFAEVRLLEAMQAIDEAFTTLSKNRDYWLTIPRLGDEHSPEIAQQYEQVRAEELELLRRLESNRRRARTLETQLAANRGGQV